MTLDEFKNVVSLLQSPDIDVVNLGRQLFPKPLGWYMMCYEWWTDIKYQGNSHAIICYTSPLPENRIEQLYANIFQI